MAATLRDVAKMAHVSVRTVSNVVNGYAPVAPTTRARVQKAIDTLGYSPNLLARGLKQGRSNLLALVLPELDTPYFAELARSFVMEGGNRGYGVFFEQSNGQHDLERDSILRADRSGIFDGLIVSPLRLSGDAIKNLAPQRPLVMLGEEPQTQFDHVLIDNQAAARAATEHLISRGARRIAVIGAPSPNAADRTHVHATNTLRFDGYRQALRQAGIAEDPSLLLPVTSFRRWAGLEAMNDLLSRSSAPDAVFCFTDPLAIGAMTAAHRRGLKVPDDLAVVGFDNVEDGRVGFVPLSTIAPDKDWIARTAMDLLLDRIAEPDRPSRQLFGPWELIVRESSR
jgi:LacI family repressor for deo operon, udp, cdd, tsx, nupC, and nupG